jgi:single-strand DNA-binding protein
MNLVLLMGRIANELELKTIGNTNFVKFNLCVAREIAKEGSQNADFIPIVAFNKTAENLCTYMEKGLKICVEGRIQVEKYTNKQNEIKYSTSIIANKIEWLEKKPKD